MPDWVQRYWEDVHEGDELPTLEFPITIARLIIEAAANRDFGRSITIPSLRGQVALRTCTQTTSSSKGCGSDLRASTSA